MSVFLALVVSFLILSHQTKTLGFLIPVEEWKEVRFKFPNRFSRNIALRTGSYIPGAAYIVDVDVDYTKPTNPRIFVTTPRITPGIPITLGTVMKDNGVSIIKPYPFYLWHRRQGKFCNRMVSVHRVSIDQCSRLWVIDTGQLSHNNLICDPKLLIFDLTTDRLILKYIFPKNVFIQTSRLESLIIDIRDNNCESTFAYIADAMGFSIIVFDLNRKMSWKVTGRQMYPHPEEGHFHIGDYKFDLMYGVTSLALSPYKEIEDDRIMFFHPLSSLRESITLSSSLRNSTIWEDGKFHSEYFETLRHKKSSQSSSAAIDRNGFMYFNLLSALNIVRWNSSTPYKSKNFEIIMEDSKALEFISSIKVIDNYEGEQEIWVVSNNYHKIVNGLINRNEINFRILSEKIKIPEKMS